MTVQPQNYNLNYLIDPTFTNVIIEYLFCHFKELLKKIIQQKVIEIFFHILCTKCQNERLQCLN